MCDNLLAVIGSKDAHIEDLKNGMKRIRQQKIEIENKLFRLQIEMADHAKDCAVKLEESIKLWSGTIEKKDSTNEEVINIIINRFRDIDNDRSEKNDRQINKCINYLENEQNKLGERVKKMDEKSKQMKEEMMLKEKKISDMTQAMELLLRENAQLKRINRLGVRLSIMVNERQQELDGKYGGPVLMKSNSGFTNNSLIGNQFPRLN